MGEFARRFYGEFRELVSADPQTQTAAVFALGAASDFDKSVVAAYALRELGADDIATLLLVARVALTPNMGQMFWGEIARRLIPQDDSPQPQAASATDGSIPQMTNILGAFGFFPGPSQGGDFGGSFPGTGGGSQGAS